MSCYKNRIYCLDCNRSYVDRNFPNHLRSRGHIDNVMKKCFCSCNTDITRCNNHDLTCCMSRLSLKSGDKPQIVFSGNQNRTRKKTDECSVKFIQKSEQAKEKNFDKYINIDPDILIVKFRMFYTGNYCDSESIAEAKAIIREIRRVEGITWEEFIFYLDIYTNKKSELK